jgi:AcrR family transcriptional regulator
MKNAVLIATATSSMGSRAVDRALAKRRAAYSDEVRRLVEASFALIRAQGRLEPRVSDVVRAAGLSNQAFYRHFRSKDELLLAVLDEGVRRLASYLRHRMERAEAPLAQVREWLSGMAAQALDPEAAAATRPFAVSRARLSELFPDEVEESERQLTAILRDALERAAARGELAGGDPARDAETLYTLAMGWMQRKLAREAPTREDAEALVEFALAGLRRELRGVRG